MRNNWKFCYFWKLAGSHRVQCLEGGGTVPHPTRSIPGGVRITRGVRGAGVQLGGDAGRMFDPSEPAWETGDYRAKLGGSQCVATSSPLDILFCGCAPPPPFGGVTGHPLSLQSRSQSCCQSRKS